jgi:hypothetical protein
MLLRFPKCGACPHGGFGATGCFAGAQAFLGKLYIGYSTIELITFLKMSEIGCLISCIAFRN